MISESLRHCVGVGPVRLQQLHDAGIRSWHDVLDRPMAIPSGIRSNLLAEAERSLAAFAANDVAYFAEQLDPRDKWRILAEYIEQTSYFDIETSGLEFDAHITVIVCWHRGELHTFVEHENLDDFLHLLDDVTLLASFNGASFDVPRVLDAFHIPELPCPHLDLRWSSYHAGLTGGLKNIATKLRIERPADIAHTDGELAIQLWSDWRDNQDAGAREHLIRYCAADVLMLVVLAQHLAQIDCDTADDLWSHLPELREASPISPRLHINRHRMFSHQFGKAGPSKLRTRRRFAG